ncbi:MAG: ABC transporter permease, partial [Chloroflexota bacterium]|nr:ABC transporter permease [Chloroflexota bacterium]
MSLISVLTRKSIADVTRRKGRTVLMILGILIAVLGLTAVNEANEMIGGAFFYSTDATTLPDITFSVNELPASVATTIQHTPNVGKFQLSMQYNSIWHIAGNGHGQLPFIQINGYSDFQHRQLGAFQLTSGRLPGRGEIVMDASDRQYGSAGLGDTIKIDALDGSTVSLHVVGLARTQGRALETLHAQALAYMSADALQQFPHAPISNNNTNNGTGQRQQGPPPVFLATEIMVKTQNADNVQQTHDEIAHILNTAHLTTYDDFFTYSVNSVDTQLAVTGLLNVIRILSIIALLLVCIMIINTVTTLLTEQMKIIGTMKALGGTRWRIVRSYLLSVGIYAIIGTVLGIVLGLLLCYEISTLVSSLTPADLGPLQVSPEVLLASIAIGLLVPLLAALFPLLMGTRMTVREAMAAYGVIAGTDRQTRAWGRQLHWVPQTVWLGLRSIFRKPGQAALTLLTLTLSCAVFMAVQITNQSIGAAVDHESNLYHDEMRIDLSNRDPVPSQRFVTAIQSLPNVNRIEPIDDEFVTIAKRQMRLTGLPADARLYHHDVVGGRWLIADEQGTLVINDFATQRLNLHVGDTVTVHLGTRQANWKIVGIVHEVSDVAGSSNAHGNLGLAFTTLENLNVGLRNLPADATTRMYASVHDRSQQALQNLQNQIQNILDNAKLQDTYVDSPLLHEGQGPNLLVAVYALFDTVAILVGLVGLLGLSHTLSASVLERRLEIGILRSLGATGWRVSAVFWIEGLA